MKIKKSHRLNYILYGFSALAFSYSNLAYAQSNQDNIVYKNTAEDFTPVLPTPVIVKVPVNILSTYIPNSANEAIELGLQAASKSDWYEVRRLLNLSTEEFAKQALLWMLVSNEKSDATFSEMDKALQTLIGFPNMRELRIRLEKNIDNYGLSDAQKIQFLARKELIIDNDIPLSGEGQMALGGLYLSQNKKEEAYKLVSNAWRKYQFEPNLQAQYMGRFSSILKPQDHDARVDLLLWTNKTSQAKSLFPYMSSQELKDANSRIKIANDEGVVLIGHSIEDKGIKFERVRELRRRDQNQAALNLLVTLNSEDLPEPAQEDIWNERRILLVEAIRSKRWEDAYKIMAQNGMKDGSKFADAEFNAGWIALRFIKNPQQALYHFQRFDNAVKTGMSKSRGYYWLGRTYESLNNNIEANKYYQLAAQYPTFYYGQLGAERLGQILGQKAILNLPKEQKASEKDKAKLNARPLMKIAKAMTQINERDLFVKFAFALDDILETNGEHQALSEFARFNNEPVVGIRVAKAGLNRGILATEAAFPFITIPTLYNYNQAENAFSLAIARQESEFNTYARSRSGALGLMQFMPATASMQAKRMGIEHSTSWLTERPEHNLTLGSAHLYDLTSRFKGSYVLAIVSYNAGPNRAIQWVDTYGEIRGINSDDAIDWVEMIPFSETRNYVQRVLENLQVYRARLNNDNSTITLIEDLTRGVKPPPQFKVKIATGAYEPLIDNASKPTDPNIEQ